MRRPRQSGYGKGIAVAIVFVFLLQAFLVSFAASATATGPMVDAFDNPLCLTGTDDGGSNLPADGHAPECCILGCTMAASLLPPPVDGIGPPAPPRVASGMPQGWQRETRVASPDYSPGRPRAPPLKA